MFTEKIEQRITGSTIQDKSFEERCSKMTFLKMAATTALLLALSPAVEAQTVNLVVIGKNISYAQTDATTLSVAGIPQFGWSPYAFYTHVSGSNINLLSPPTIAGPTSAFVNSSPYYNGGVLGYNNFAGDWEIGSGAAVPNNWGAPSLSQLNADFANGQYSLNVGGNAINLNLTGDAYANTPLVTLGGGVWSGGNYVIDASQSLTITSSAFNGFGGIPNASIFGGVLGVGTSLIISGTPGASNFLQMTLPAFSLQAGNTYIGEASFRTAVDFNFVGGSANIAEYESLTHFSIVAVPEPGTYAMLLAGLMMLGFMSRRRWKHGRAFI